MNIYKDAVTDIVTKFFKAYEGQPFARSMFYIEDISWEYDENGCSIRRLVTDRLRPEVIELMSRLCIQHNLPEDFIQIDKIYYSNGLSLDLNSCYLMCPVTYNITWEWEK